MTITSLTRALALAAAICATPGAAAAQTDVPPASPAAATPVQIAALDPTTLTEAQVTALADYEGTVIPEHAERLVSEVVTRLNETADNVGAPHPTLNLEVLRQMVDAALPRVPTDPGLPFSYAVRFEITPGNPPADLTEGKGVMADARACVMEGVDSVVVHFQRAAERGYLGHHCVLLYNGSEGRTLQSELYMRGETRDILVAYLFVVGLGSSWDASDIVLNRTLGANVALSQALGARAFDVLLDVPAP